MRTLGCAAIIALTWLAPRMSSAQSAFTIEAGLVTAFEDASLVQLGFRVTAAKVQRAGVDFALATFPEGVAEGIVLLTPDLDVTLPVQIGEGGGWLMPRIGPSALVGFGGGGGGAIAGYNIGIGVLGMASARTAIRLDLTYRRYMIDDPDASLFVVTAGIGWLR